MIVSAPRKLINAHEVISQRNAVEAQTLKAYRGRGDRGFVTQCVNGADT
jgi:hypothetical protein